MDLKNLPLYESLFNQIDNLDIEKRKTIIEQNTSLNSTDVDSFLKKIEMPVSHKHKLKILDETLVEKKSKKEFRKKFKYKLFFGKESIEDINWLISLNPAFEVTLYYTNLARKNTKFPIANYKGFETLLKIKPHPKIRLNRISSKAIQKYFDDSMFPIGSITDFRSKIFAAMTWGAVCHHNEDYVKRQKQKPLYHALQSTTSLNKN